MIQVNDDNFNEVKESDLSLVKVGAEWCGPCRMIKPTIEEISNDYEGRLVVGDVNVDDKIESISEFNIKSIPTILMFKKGELVEKVTGMVSKTQLEDMIKTHL
jgi:thioredoxin 1